MLLFSCRSPKRRCSERHNLDCRGSRFGARYRVNVLCAMPTILDSVRIVDLVVDGGIAVLKCGIFLNATGDDAAFMTNLCAT